MNRKKTAAIIITVFSVISSLVIIQLLPPEPQQTPANKQKQIAAHVSINARYVISIDPQWYWPPGMENISENDIINPFTMLLPARLSDIYSQSDALDNAGIKIFSPDGVLLSEGNGTLSIRLPADSEYVFEVSHDNIKTSKKVIIPLYYPDRENITVPYRDGGSGVVIEILSVYSLSDQMWAWFADAPYMCVD